MNIGDRDDFWLGFLAGTIGTLVVITAAMWVLGAMFDL